MVEIARLHATDEMPHPLLAGEVFALPFLEALAGLTGGAFEQPR
jgi:hypothetical protein